MSKIKLGIVGLGHLGKIHLQNALKVEAFEIVGIFDIHEKTVNEQAEKYQLKAFSSYESLLNEVDAVDIVSATSAHFDLAIKAIENNKHVFVEKPITSTLQQAIQLTEALKKKPFVKMQVGHVERFNPAYLAVKNRTLQPKFIEIHRLSMFNPRGNDVSVVMDLMIHDLDLLLKIVQSNVKNIDANGVAIVCETEDICNARIEFENGCVANVTASRLSMKQMRKMRLFQNDAYISLDFLNKKTEIITLENAIDGEDDNLIIDNGKTKKKIGIEMPDSPPINAIETELSYFANAIIHNKEPEVTAFDGLKAIDLAEKIECKMKEKI